MGPVTSDPGTSDPGISDPGISDPGISDPVTSNPDGQDRALAEFVHRNPRLFVLTGAGCSTASGLGDYRNQQGQWKRRQPITGQTFIQNTHARRRYWARSYVGWQFFSVATPNDAHYALVTMQQRDTVQHLVTQNVDQLHQKAGHRDVLDLHGVLGRVGCLDCAYSVARDHYQDNLLDSNPWLASLQAEHAPDGDADLEEESLEQMNIPACDQCGGLMKPEVVFFGENVPKKTVERAMQQLQSSDALLVVGSSLMVFSGYRFCRDAAKRKQPIAIVNNGKTRADDLASLRIDGDCGQRLIKLAEST